MVDGPGPNLAAGPDLNTASGPGLTVDGQPGSQGPGPRPMPSPWGRRTDFQQTSQGYRQGCSPHPMPVSRMCRQGGCDVHRRPREPLGMGRPHHLPHIASMGTTARLLFLVKVIFGEWMIDQEFSSLLPPLCFWFKAFLCHRQ